MKEKNPKNTVGISFSSEAELLANAKIRMRELGIRSFSEYVKQLIKYDLGLPNYIGQYISKNIGVVNSKTTAEDSAFAAAFAARHGNRKRNKDASA